MWRFSEHSWVPIRWCFSIFLYTDHLFSSFMSQPLLIPQCLKDRVITKLKVTVRLQGLKRSKCPCDRWAEWICGAFRRPEEHPDLCNLIEDKKQTGKEKQFGLLPAETPHCKLYYLAFMATVKRVLKSYMQLCDIYFDPMASNTFIHVI